MRTVWVAVAMASYMGTAAVETVAAAAAVPPTTRRRRVVDAHVHVWGDGSPPYPYVMPAPPAELVAAGSPAQLISLMDASHVDHAVVIQPIQYLYDHQYLLNVMQANPECKRRFKYMALFDPTLDDAAFGECLLDGLARQGFVGVRFNPTLFPNEQMADKDGKGAAWMRKCGALNLVVGIMCFKGLSRHYDDVVALLEAGPDTNVIIDHMGFFVQNGQVDETSFAQVTHPSLPDRSPSYSPTALPHPRPPRRTTAPVAGTVSKRACENLRALSCFDRTVSPQGLGRPYDASCRRVRFPPVAVWH